MKYFDDLDRFLKGCLRPPCNQLNSEIEETITTSLRLSLLSERGIAELIKNYSGGLLMISALFLLMIALIF